VLQFYEYEEKMLARWRHVESSSNVENISFQDWKSGDDN